MVKEEKTMLFDAILREGVVKVCEDCSVKEGIPIIRKISKLQLKESEKNQTVYEKLSRMAGLDPKEHKAKFGSGVAKVGRQNEDLRKLVEEKSELSFPGLKQSRLDVKDDLIRNYHWAILRARRARRVTQMQLAEAIAEPEASIKLVERGILPDNYHSFIRKIQTYLGITIFSKPVKKQLGFNSVSSKSLTISDLQEIKENVDEKKSSFFPYWKKKLGFLKKKREKRNEEYVNLEDLEEVNRILESSELKVEKDSEHKEEELFKESLEVKAEVKIAEESVTKANEPSSESSEEKPEETREPKKEEVKDGADELSKEEMDKIIFGNEKF